MKLAPAMYISEKNINCLKQITNVHRIGLVELEEFAVWGQVENQWEQICKNKAEVKTSPRQQKWCKMNHKYIMFKCMYMVFEAQLKPNLLESMISI